MDRGKFIGLIDRALSPFNLVLRKRSTWNRIVSTLDTESESTEESQSDHPTAANVPEISVQEREAPSPSEQKLYYELELLKKTMEKERSELATYAMRFHRDAWIKRNLIEGRDLHYRPTHNGFDLYINSDQQYFARCPKQGDCIIDEIPGWLTAEDAMKLYEMAYYSDHDILELGTYHGLSTSIMARAVVAAGGATRIYTVDITASCTQKAKQHLRKSGIDSVVHFLQGDGVALCQVFAEKGRRFGFVFVDHSHRYQDVYAVCQSLENIVIARGHCLFHDFTNSINFNPTHKYYDSYGVPHAVLDALPTDFFEFCGLFGASALYRRR